MEPVTSTTVAVTVDGEMQHLWFTEHLIDVVANDFELDPVDVGKRKYICLGR